MNYKTGDILKGSINKYPFIYHYGVLLVKDGQVTVIHNSPNEKNEHGGNVLRNDLQKWLKTRKIAHVQRANISEGLILKTADKYKSRPFNLFSFNCEHFIFEIRDGRPHSPQLIEVGYHILTIVMVIYTIRNRILLKSMK